MQRRVHASRAARSTGASSCCPMSTPSWLGPAAKSAPGSRMSAKDVPAITAYHNKVRADVGVGPMKWSATLAAYAQEWADHLAATTCRMAHRTELKYVIVACNY